jgi:hypothetical protein
MTSTQPRARLPPVARPTVRTPSCRPSLAPTPASALELPAADRTSSRGMPT